MNILTIFISYFLLIFTLLSGTTYAQENEEVIEAELKSTFNQEFLVSVYNMMESSKWKVELGFSDPYGTLNDSYIFLARPFRPEEDENPNGFVGIYKSGTIIWHSDREINSDIVVNAELLGTLDLNNDGQVEIITEWYMGMKGGNTDLWIYSWDGASGQRLNQLVEGGKSSIKATMASVKIVDVEPDGVKEILGKDRRSNLNVYSWNGRFYGNGGMVLPDRLPRNAITVVVNMEIQIKNNQLRYKYVVKNSAQSLQSIEEFALRRLVKEKKNDKPEGWTFRANLKKSLMSWQVGTPVNYHRNALLRPGEQAEFYLVTDSNRIPTPSKFYVKGNNGDLTFSVKDILTNSVAGTTIVPSDPSSSFDLSVFTDSLRSYTAQACELEWITNKGICRSLKAKLQSVQKQLGRGNTKAASGPLGAFLNEVEAQNGKKITSEAYALLFFNGQYLLDKLREE